MMEVILTFIIYSTNNMNTGHAIDDSVCYVSSRINLFNLFTRGLISVE